MRRELSGVIAKPFPSTMLAHRLLVTRWLFTKNRERLLEARRENSPLTICWSAGLSGSAATSRCKVSAEGTIEDRTRIAFCVAQQPRATASRRRGAHLPGRSNAALRPEGAP
jgi:hypothetical protein